MAHAVFDVKYDGCKRARIAGGGHLTEPTDDVSYSGIALLQVICAVIFIAILNDLEICACDIGSAYLEAFTREKLYIIAGPKFKDLKGHMLLVNKAYMDYAHLELVGQKHWLIIFLTLDGSSVRLTQLFGL